MTVATRLTAAEYLRLPETTQPMQLIHGEVIMTPAPVSRHQDFVLEFAKLVEALARGGKVQISPIDVALSDVNVVQPDVMWVAPDNEECVLVDGKYWQGPPDLVVEVLSPSTARLDKGEKFKLYEHYGVRECWLADPEADYVEVWQRESGESGESETLHRFAQLGVFGPDETFESVVLGGKTVQLTAIFARK